MSTQDAKRNTYRANLHPPEEEGGPYAYSVEVGYPPSATHPLGYTWTSPQADLNARNKEDALVEMSERVGHLMLLVQGGQVTPLPPPVQPGITRSGPMRPVRDVPIQGGQEGEPPV